MNQEQTCQHKWKIMKTIERTHTNFIKQNKPCGEKHGWDLSEIKKRALRSSYMG